MRFYKLKYAVLNRVLAALLVFVITGIQLMAVFHYHPANHLTVQNPVKVKQVSINSLSERCKICDLLAHNLSLDYYLPAVFIFYISDFVQKIFTPTFPFKLDAEILGFSNKGPPLI